MSMGFLKGGEGCSRKWWGESVTKTLSCLGYIGDEILPRSIGILSQYFWIPS